MSKYCKEFKEHVTKITNCEKLNFFTLTEKGNKSHKKQKICNTCKLKFDRFF